MKCYFEQLTESHTEQKYDRGDYEFCKSTVMRLSLKVRW